MNPLGEYLGKMTVNTGPVLRAGGCSHCFAMQLLDQPRPAGSTVQAAARAALRSCAAREMIEPPRRWRPIQTDLVANLRRWSDCPPSSCSGLFNRETEVCPFAMARTVEGGTGFAKCWPDSAIAQARASKLCMERRATLLVAVAPFVASLGRAKVAMYASPDTLPVRRVCVAQPPMMDRTACRSAYRPATCVDSCRSRILEAVSSGQSP